MYSIYDQVTVAILFQQFEHHDALDDAKVCAKIPLVAGRTVGVDNMDSLLGKIGLEAKIFKS